MSLVYGDEGFPPQWDEQQGSSAHEEKIFVSIRVRPLNDTEISRNDVADWECINNTTILFKNNVAGERTTLPTAYHFDRVFGCECSTREVYDEAVKRVFLSVLSGINSSIFAYGQTSSGKTYTMSGVTDYAVQDIYDYINKHTERKFVLKFSAIEIYNEVVRDLLSSDNAPLRLLDDPERGTVVEKLSEVNLRDQSHLNELLSVCEAQRQIGETSLNGMSSRSHQILRLTVESSANHFSKARNNSTLSAAVNFIDLAGSERASQTLSAGMRLKEGSHINRSLLTLGTVIRKLSKGRNGHIPYRDSKLTRILQNSLGGNARTAIICTMSPAHSHFEQSRNTLLFATCAKQVATKAQVNVVISDKALVKQLQKELARLENELKLLKSRSTDETSTLVLKEKEEVIEKMEREMRELMMQRDISQFRMQNLLRSRPWGEMSYQSETPEYTASESTTPFHSRISSFSDRFEAVAEACDDQFLSDDTSPRLFINKYFGPNPCKDLQIATHKSNHSFTDSCEGDKSIEMESNHSTENVDSNGDQDSGYHFDFEHMRHSPSSLDTDISYSNSKPRSRRHKAILTVNLGQKENREHKDFDEKITHSEAAAEFGEVLTTESNNPANDEPLDVKEQNFKISTEDVTACEAEFATTPNESNFPMDVKEQNFKISKDDVTACEAEFATKPDEDAKAEVENKICHECEVNNGKVLATDSNSHSNDVKEQNFKVSMDDVTAREVEFAATPDKDAKSMPEVQFCDEKENLKPVPEKQLSNDLDAEQKTEALLAEVANSTGLVAVEEAEVTKALLTTNDLQQTPDWSKEFEGQKREIIELWDECHVPLVHRTYFFLLFKGDPTDAVYMEVELRQLHFLKNSWSRGERVVKDGQILSEVASLKGLKREKEMLCRQMLKIFTASERNELFKQWGVGINTKQRRLQLCNKLWKNNKNMEHLKKSASLIAKIVGFIEPNEASKEMFGLSFAPQPMNLRTYSWSPRMPFTI